MPAAERSKRLSSSFGLGEKLFASSDERRFVDSIAQGLDIVEDGLLDQMHFADEIANATSRYLLEAGGKRVRPVLTLMTAQLGEGNTSDVLLAAQAIEITHVASLYHDDVMDDAPSRRGVPTAHNVWGNSVAILTGDLLFARASKIGAQLGERVLALQAETFERLCLGQLRETLGPRPDEDPIAHYLQVLSDKTGSLISAAAQVGVILSNAPKEYLEPVAVYGEKIGVAFQLIDDIIDLSPEADNTGKTAGTDLRAGVATLPVLYLRQLAKTDYDADDLLRRIDRDVTSAFYTEADTDELAAAIAQLRDHPVTAQTLVEAHRWAREAVEALDPLPDGPVKKALTRFADTIVERST